MMDFSKDPREAEKQIQAIIYYLVTFGYIDGDFDPEEHKRVASLSSALCSVNWEGAKINLLDTPGYLDRRRF